MSVSYVTKEAYIKMKVIFRKGFEGWSLLMNIATKFEKLQSKK